MVSVSEALISTRQSPASESERSNVSSFVNRLTEADFVDEPSILRNITRCRIMNGVKYTKKNARELVERIADNFLLLIVPSFPCPFINIAKFELINYPFKKERRRRRKK